MKGYILRSGNIGILFKSNDWFQRVPTGCREINILAETLYDMSRLS